MYVCIHIFGTSSNNYGLAYMICGLNICSDDKNQFDYIQSPGFGGIDEDRIMLLLYNMWKAKSNII